MQAIVRDQTRLRIVGAPKTRPKDFLAQMAEMRDHWGPTRTVEQGGQ
jgi:hypothetical protein